MRARDGVDTLGQKEKNTIEIFPFISLDACACIGFEDTYHLVDMHC
jgi:hypothetical protein